MTQSAAASAVYAVFPDRMTADRIATEMIEQGVAACANILSPCQSIYRWKGRVERAVEIPVLFKTATARLDALMAAIAFAHPYDVPAITAWPINAHQPYLDWINSETQS